MPVPVPRAGAAIDVPCWVPSRLFSTVTRGSVQSDLSAYTGTGVGTGIGTGIGTPPVPGPCRSRAMPTPHT